MKNKLSIGLLTLILCLILSGCGSSTTNTNKNVNGTSKQQSQNENKQTATTWPTNTIFPQPEGCKIIEVKKEDWKNYITVEWDNKAAAKKYIEKIKEVEGSEAEIIGQGETDDTIYYGTYAITVTSMNEPQNIILYK